MKKLFPVLRKALLALTFAGVLLVLAATLIGCSGRHGYLADQCSQLRIAYVDALLLLFFTMLILRSRPGTILAALALCLNMFYIVPFYLPSEAASAKTPAAGGADIDIVTINIYGAHNAHFDKVIDFVREKHPQVLCLDEITKPWLERLNTDLPEYKYRFDEGLSGGAAIYSRIPIVQCGPEDVPHIRRFGVRGKLAIGDQQVMIIAEHPPAPTCVGSWQHRNAELKRLTAEAENAAVPLILIGDLNSTPWSPYFHELVKGGKLVDSEQGIGIQPSWNALLPVPPMVPIDHCLTSNQFVVVQRSLGPNVGSDHLPVCVRLRLKDKT